MPEVKSMRGKPQGKGEDVAERKRAEEALRQAAAQWQDTFDAVEDMVMIIDQEFRVVRANQAVSKALPGVKVIGAHCYALIHDTEAPIPNCPSYQTFRSGEAIHAEICEQHLGGRLFDVSAYPIKDKDGTVQLVVHVLRDITERKQVEEALRESEERLRAFIENAPDAIFVYDTMGNLIDVNSNVQELIGYSREELIGRNFAEMGAISEEQILKTMEGLEKTKMGEFTEPFELELITKEGSRVYVEIMAFTVPRRGHMETWGIARDITERKRAEEALQESEEKLRVMFQSINDGIAVVDLEGKIVEANQVHLGMLGYSSEEELIGQNAFDSIAERDQARAREGMGKLFEEEHSTPTEYTLKNKDGREFDVELTAALLRDGSGKPARVVSVIRNVTERKRMEQQLHLAGRLAAVGELAAGVAHELNNPLAAVQAFAQLLNERDDLDETVKSDVGTIYKEAQRASRITANLLSFAHRHAPEKHLISINEVVEKALELHAYRMKVNNIEIVTDLEPDLPMLMADFHQMQQVFVNIITNAEQAIMEAHGRGKLLVSTQRAGGMIQVTFTDDGPGIPENNLKRIFDPFFTTKDVGEGTGLGLSICYGIVQKHGGHLYARSKPGQGATFVVEIPVISEDQLTIEQNDSIQVQGD